MSFNVLFGDNFIGNAVGNTSTGTGAGQVDGASEVSSKATRFVKMSSVMCSVSGPRFWIVTVAFFVADGVLDERLIVFGTVMLTMERSCGRMGAVRPVVAKLSRATSLLETATADE